MQWLNLLSTLILTCCLSGCNLFYAFIANAYRNQPTILKSHYPSAKGVHFKKRPRNNLNFAQLKPPTDRLKSPTNISLAFASSGGGYRASNLMLGTMMAMSQLPSIRQQPNFLADIDYFSTVSGSGLAVGYYLSHYLDGQQHHKTFHLDKHIQKILRQDQRSGKPNALRQNLDPFLFTGHTTGSIQLQKAFGGLFSVGKHKLTLGDIFIAKKAKESPTLPYWVVNTTIFQNMLSFPFIPSKLSEYQIVGYQDGITQHLKPPKTQKMLFYRNIPMSLAQSASASYPIALTPITLTSNACHPNCYLQLFDGGVSDNLGVISAIKALMESQQKIKILFMLDAASVKDSPFSANQMPPTLFSFIEKTPSMVTDGQSEQIRNNINHFIHSFLCQKDTTNAIGIYLALDKYRSALNLNTSFNSSLAEQKKLMKIGQDMIKNNKQVQELIRQIKQGRINMGRCTQNDHLIHVRNNTEDPFGPLRKALHESD